MVEYTRASPTGQIIRAAAVTSVDPVNQLATMTTRDLSVITVDTSYYVGATQVTPTVGDQWQVEKVNGNWRLKGQLPFNTPNDIAITPTAGQHVVGSGNGPVELQGTQINANAPLATAAYTTATLPDPTKVPAGTLVYNTTISQPVWSDGTSWGSATGSGSISGGSP